jgi:hypothetical protein
VAAVLQVPPATSTSQVKAPSLSQGGGRNDHPAQYQHTHTHTHTHTQHWF